MFLRLPYRFWREPDVNLLTDIILGIRQDDDPDESFFDSYCFLSEHYRLSLCELLSSRLWEISIPIMSG